MQKNIKKLIVTIILCLMLLIVNVGQASASNILGDITNWINKVLKTESTLDVKLVKDSNDTRKAYLTATDPNNKIIKVKIKKVDTYEEKVDFTKQGSEVSITPGNEVKVEIKVIEDGIYKIAVINEKDQMMITTTMFYEEYFMNMDLKENVDNPGEIKINANDVYFNIVKLKIAKTSDIENADIEEEKKTINYFKKYNYGTDIPITASKNIQTTYNVTENGYYTLYIEDEKKNSYAKNVLVNAISDAELKATVKYDITTCTNKDVTATITFNKDDVKITNNDGKDTYTFKQNGEFTFTYTDILGNQGQTKASVNWIDKNAPTISNVTDGKKYTNPVTPKIEDKETQVSVELQKDGQKINYTNGDTISANGNYTLIATDQAGNTTTIKFTIEKEINDSISSNKYTIKENIIYRILPETKVSEYKRNITVGCNYRIVNSQNKELADNDYITTNSKIILETGAQYTILVIGDLDYDGMLKIADLAQIQKVYLGIDTINNKIELLDINNDNEFNLNDLAKIQKLYLGIQ